MTESPDPLPALVLQFLDWVAVQPRRHEEVMDAWRTSCPRLPVWEEAVERGLVCRVNGSRQVVITAAGRAELAAHGAAAATSVEERA
jgi:hypothetical protein